MSLGKNKPVFGDFSGVSQQRWNEVKLEVNRQLVPYDQEFHKHRAIFFPGHDENRLLTHFYSQMFFADPREDKRTKRLVRDRMRYLDVVYCAAGRVVEQLHDFIAREGSSASAKEDSGEPTYDDLK